MKTRFLTRRVMIGLAAAMIAIFAVPEIGATDPLPLGSTDIMSLEELMNIPVYGASKYEQKLTEAPSSVSIVTSRDISKYGYRTLTDIIRGQRGFYVTYDRNYHYMGNRGFLRPGDYNSRVLLLVDGHRTNDALYDSAAIGTSFILDVDLIDRVEFIRGPSSSLYGSNAFFGVINVITKTGKAYRGAELSGEAGSFETYKARATYGNRGESGIQGVVSGTWYDSQGDDRLFFPEFDDPLTNNGIAENADGDKYYSFFTTLSWHDFTLQGAYNERDKDIPTAPWDTFFNDSRTMTRDGLAYVVLKYERYFGRGWNVQAKASYNHYWYDGDYVYDWNEDPLDPFLVVNRDE
ncbi:MAG: TonB-dependent receptor plug domain-containing protein, partial [Deltaproteobacteria bacterium]|nr:TonB-dependent receptor plug domain-containing protein [Deltaproteobacteria bacterium]